MALPTLKMALELPVEQRIARLEVTVDHIQSDITEMKADIRRLDTKIDGVKDSMTASFAAVNASIATLALTTEKSISGLTRWGLTLYIGLVAGLVTAFMWIAERLPPVQ